MLKRLLNFLKSLNKIIYIRLLNDEIYFLSYPSGETYQDIPILKVQTKGKQAKVTAVGHKVNSIPLDEDSQVYKPFNSTVTEQKNFDLCEKILRYFINQKILARSTLILPRIIIHPNKEYLSELEEQAYKEMSLAAGGREVRVYLGKELQANQLEDIFKMQSQL